MIIGIDGNEANVTRRVGSNQYAFELLSAISSQQSDNRKQTANSFTIYLRDQPLSDMPESSENWQYRVIKPRKFWTQFRLPIDLFLHKPRPNIFFTPGHYAPRWSPVSRVISIMDLGYLKFPGQFTRKDLYQLKNWTARSIKSASHIFAISQSTKNDIIDKYGIPEERITVTYPGYDREKFGIRNQELGTRKIKEKYGIKGDYILFLSTLKPNKNVEGLLEAFSQLTGLNPVKLVIAGKKGWLYKTIFEKVRRLGLEEKVIFTDFVREDDVPALMAGASVFILPSFWEGFGIPVIEAMACGVPVVVSNAGSLPEVVGEAGVIIDPYSLEDIGRGIKEAIENKSQLAKKGLEQVKKFSWEECARKTLTVLEKI